MLLKIILTGRVLTALTMLIIFLSMTLIGLGFSEAARLMPLMIGIPGTILSLVQFIMEFRVARAELSIIPDDNALQNQKQSRKNEIQMIVWMLLFCIGLLCFGFKYAAPVLVFTFLYIGKKESLVTAIISGVATFLVIYGFFEKTLEIPLFNGLIIEWLAG